MKTDRMERGEMTPAEVDYYDTSLDEGPDVQAALTEEELERVTGGVSQPCDLDW